MGQRLGAAGGSAFLNLLPSLTITTALTKQVSSAGALPAPPMKLSEAKYLVAQAVFTYGSGGTTVDAYVQTSIDQGTTWVDIINFHFTTASKTSISAVVFTVALTASTVPSNGALASDSIVNGLIGDRFRVIVTSTGTYATNTTLAITAYTKG